MPFFGDTVAHLISTQCSGLIEVRQIEKGRLTNGRRRCREAAKDEDWRGEKAMRDGSENKKNR